MDRLPRPEDLLGRLSRARSIGDRQAGRLALEHLLHHQFADQHASAIADASVSTAIFLGEEAPSLSFHPVRLDLPPEWGQFHPSIARADDGFRMILRTVNSGQPPVRHRPADGIYRSVNYLLDLTESFDIRDVQRLRDFTMRPPAPHLRHQGFDDCRLIRIGDKWSAVVVHFSPSRCAKERALMTRFGLVDLDGDRFVRFRDLAVEPTPRAQKNWMPVVGADELTMLYSVAPTVVLRWDDEAGCLGQIEHWEGPRIALPFHGSTQLVPIPGGYLCLVHQRLQTRTVGPLYQHRFVTFDADFRMTGLSLPFSFRAVGIEFAGGLARSGDHLTISFGVQDSEAWLAQLDLQDALALIYPVADGPPVTAPVHRPARLRLTAVMFATGDDDRIVESIRSVADHVDRIALIDCGLCDQQRQLLSTIVGDRLTLLRAPAVRDAAALLNWALDLAAAIGADWILWLEPGERLELDGGTLRDRLVDCRSDIVTLTTAADGWRKPAVFRPSLSIRFVWPVRPRLEIANRPVQHLSGVCLRSDGEPTVAELTTIISDLRAADDSWQEQPRWCFLMGDALERIGQPDVAAEFFALCMHLPGWAHGRAVSAARLGAILLQIDQVDAAYTAWRHGMQADPACPELARMVARLHDGAGAVDEARLWANAEIDLARQCAQRLGEHHREAPLPGAWGGQPDSLRADLPGSAGGQATRLVDSAPPEHVLPMRLHAQSYLASMDQIDGWMSSPTAAVIADLLAVQRLARLEGDILEIGVHHGRLLILLALSLQPGEYALGVDLFSRQAENIDQSGLGSRPMTERHLSQFVPGADVRLLEANSCELGQTFLQQHARMRFVSVDGGHTREATVNDLRIAQQAAIPGAIVALDDIYRAEWSGVTAGLARYVADGGTLMPFALIPNKVLLTTDPAWAAFYQRRLERLHGRGRRVEFFDADDVAMLSEAEILQPKVDTDSPTKVGSTRPVVSKQNGAARRRRGLAGETGTGA